MVLRQRPQPQQRKTRPQGTTGRIDHDTFTERQTTRFNLTELVPLARGIRMESNVRAVKPQVLLTDSRPTDDSKVPRRKACPSAQLFLLDGEIQGETSVENRWNTPR